MKKGRQIHIFLLIIVSMNINISCKNTIDVDKINGQWFVMESNIKSDFLDSKTILNSKNKIQNSSFYFFHDKRFQIDYHLSSNECYTGIWDYFSSENELVFFHDNLNIEIESYKIQELSKEILVLKNANDSIGTVVLKLCKYKN